MARSDFMEAQIFFPPPNKFLHHQQQLIFIHLVMLTFQSFFKHLLEASFADVSLEMRRLGLSISKLAKADTLSFPDLLGKKKSLYANVQHGKRHWNALKFWWETWCSLNRIGSLENCETNRYTPYCWLVWFLSVREFSHTEPSDFVVRSYFTRLMRVKTPKPVSS